MEISVLGELVTSRRLGIERDLPNHQIIIYRVNRTTRPKTRPIYAPLVLLQFSASESDEKSIIQKSPSPTLFAQGYLFDITNSAYKDVVL